MTREEAFRLAMRACEEMWDEKTCKQIKEALEQEPCEDAISRQGTIDAMIKRFDGENAHDQFWNCDMVMDVLHDMPSVNPQPKMGHWIKIDGVNAICSCCNRPNHLYGTYCKHCGAEMVEPHESCDTCKHKDEEWDSDACDGCCGNHSGFKPCESEDAEWLKKN